MLIQSVLYETHNPFNFSAQVEVIWKPSQVQMGAILLLHGGEDVNPSLYKHKCNNHTFFNKQRDDTEWFILDKAREMNNPIVGICRGAQLLCAYDGGTLYQHLRNHKTTGSGHIVTDKLNPKYKFWTNSYHHQAMNPRKTGPQLPIILGTVEEPTLAEEDTNKPIELNEVNEFVYFPKIRALGIQGHPEWSHANSEFNFFCTKKIKELLL